MFAGGAARAQSAVDPSVEAMWRQLELVDAQDNTFTIGSSGKPLTLVKLWANWCPVCTNEIGQLNELVAKVGPENLHVVLISHPNWWEQDQEAARRRGINFTLATPDRSNGFEAIQAALTDRHGLYAVPRTLVFKNATASAAKQGGRGAGAEIVLAHQGAMDWTSGRVVAELKEAVA